MHGPTASTKTPETSVSPVDIRHEQVRRLIDSAPNAAGMTLLAAVLLLWIVPRPLHDPALLAWVFAFLLQLVVRLGMMVGFRRIRPGSNEISPWFLGVVLSALFTGIVWGSSAGLFIGSDFGDAQALLTLIVASLGAGAAVHLGVSWLAGASFMVPLVIPYAWLFAASGVQWGNTMAIILFLFLAAMLLVSHRLSRLVGDHIESSQRFEALARHTETELRGYRNMVESTLAILWEGRAGTFEFSYVSPEAEALLGYPPKQWLDDPDFWPSRIHPDDRQWAVDFCKSSTEAGRSHVFDYRMIAADGRIVWLRDYVNVVNSEDGEARLVGVMIDISELKQVETQREELASLQQLIVDTSRHLLSTRVENFDGVIDRALAKLGHLCEVDRAYFIRLSDDRSTYSNTHEWVATGAEGQKSRLQARPLDEIRNLVARLENNDPVVIEDPARLDASWQAERELFENLGIQSLIALPVMIDGGLIGIVGMDTSQTRRPFHQEEISVLAVLSELIGAALQHRESTRRMRRVEAMREHAENMAQMGSWQWDIENDVFEASDEWCRVTGLQQGQFTRDQVIALTLEEERELVQAHLAETLRSGRTYQIEHRIERADNNEQRWVRVSAELDLENENRPLLRGFTQDITDSKQVEQRMFDLAHFDYLTGLPNRMFARQQIEQALARASRKKSQVALMFLDLDRFKKVNDTLGHESGDAVLIDAGQRLAGLFREQDVIARIGGDEFVILIEGSMSLITLAAMARKIVNAFRAPLKAEQHEFVLTASVGIAVSPQDGTTANELLQKADTAMYHAKRSGRSRFQFITPEMNESVERSARIEESIHGALSRGEIRSVFQPIFSLKTHRLKTLELLMRWEHPELGAVRPDEFIQIAEQCGRIVELGSFVLEDGISRLARWRAAGHSDLQLAINISPHQLRDPGLLELIEQCLHKAELPGDALEIEITENVLLSAGDQLQLTLARLRALGVGIAMDDFGTGYSSLSYLRDYPFTALKIDRGFVRGLDRDQRKRQLVNAAIEMGHALDLKVVAEGVELETELQELSRSDIDAVQGYLLSRPLESGKIRDFLKEANRPDFVQQYLH